MRKDIEELPLSGIELLLHLSESYPALSLGIGEPNFDTPPHVIQAAVRALELGKTHYSPDRGLKELRDAIAEKTRRENYFEPDPVDEIIVTSGTSPALYGAIQTNIDPGDEVIIPTPSYFAYDSIVRISEAKQLAGDRVGLMGNVDTTLLVNGTPDAVALAADECITESENKGGYILSTSCDTPIEVPEENMAALVAASMNNTS